MGADISSAYLLADTKEEAFFIGDKAFGDLDGHIIYIVKAQYGLRTSGVQWHDKLFETLTSLGFKDPRCLHALWHKQTWSRMLGIRRHLC